MVPADAAVPRAVEDATAAEPDDEQRARSTRDSPRRRLIEIPLPSLPAAFSPWEAASMPPPKLLEQRAAQVCLLRTLHSHLPVSV